jgi:hypothetical protein
MPLSLGSAVALSLRPSPSRDTCGIADLAECCGEDTPLTSLSNASRRRPTTNQQGRFVIPWLTLILRSIGPTLAPAHFPTPLRAGAND